MNAHIPRSVEELKKLTTQQLMDSMLKWSSEWSEYGDSGAKTQRTAMESRLWEALKQARDEVAFLENRLSKEIK